MQHFRFFLALGLLNFVASAQIKYTPYAFTTIAGEPLIAGTRNGLGGTSLFDGPNGIAADRNGNVFVCDQWGYTIRMITPNGEVSTIAGAANQEGSRNGYGGSARFYYPWGLAADKLGNLYVSESGNNTIRKITRQGANWIVSTLAGEAGVSGAQDGTGPIAHFYAPDGLAIDLEGNVIVADFGNDIIRKVTQDGVVTTLAGVAGVSGFSDGTNVTARFNIPTGVAVDYLGNIFVADAGNNTIREMSLIGTNWVVSTIAGRTGLAGSTDGIGRNAEFSTPNGLAFDGFGSLFVTDYGNQTIRRLTPFGGGWNVTTLAGRPTFTGVSDGTGGSVRFHSPTFLTVDSVGGLYVTDRDNCTIRRGSSATAAPVLSIAPARQSLPASPVSVVLSGTVNQIVIVETSTDLLGWVPISTNESGTGSSSVTDPKSSPSINLYYRALQR